MIVIMKKGGAGGRVLFCPYCGLFDITLLKKSYNHLGPFGYETAIKYKCDTCGCEFYEQFGEDVEEGVEEENDPE